MIEVIKYLIMVSVILIGLLSYFAYLESKMPSRDISED